MRAVGYLIKQQSAHNDKTTRKHSSNLELDVDAVGDEYISGHVRGEICDLNEQHSQLMSLSLDVMHRSFFSLKMEFEMNDLKQSKTK